MSRSNVADIVGPLIRLAIWWLLVRWSGEAVLVYGRGALLIQAWLFVTAFLLHVVLSAFPRTASLVVLLVYAFVWFLLSSLAGIDGASTWWKLADIGCIFCGWLTAHLALKAWLGMKRRLKPHAL